MTSKLNFVYPPDFDQAYKHRLANRIFKGNLDQAPVQECQCCARRIGSPSVQTPCSIDPMKLSFLGPGVPLFFYFLKSVIILLLLQLLTFSVFSIYSNVISGSCQANPQCLKDVFNLVSIVNKEGETRHLSVQSYLGLTYVFLAIIYLHYFRFKARQLEEECDQIVDSPSDYAIVLRRLPTEVTEEDILALVEQRRKDLNQEQLKDTEQLKVNNIVLSYNLRQYIRVREENKQEFERCMKEDRVADFIPKELPKPSKTSQVAVVVFQHQQSKDFFIIKPTIQQQILSFFCTACTPLSQMTVKGQQVAIERAPEPDEIYWQNCGITMEGSICRKLWFGLISLLILGVAALAQYGIALAQSNNKDSHVRQVLKYAINPFTVFTISSILKQVLVFLTHKERNETVIEFQSVLVVKIALLQFFNAGVFVVGASIAVKYSNFDLGNGIISSIFVIMAMDAIIPNLRNLFMTYTELQTGQSCGQSGMDMELNKMCTGPEISLPAKYAYILKVLLLTALYAPMFPVVVLVALVGMIFNYLVEKFLFANSYSVPHNISAMTFKSSTELLEYFLITFAVGQLLVYAYFRNFRITQMPEEWNVTIFMTLGLAVLNASLPMDSINEWLFPVKEASRSSLTYSQVESHFEATYQMLNPAYKGELVRSKNRIHLPKQEQSEQGQFCQQLTSDGLLRQSFLECPEGMSGKQRGGLQLELFLSQKPSSQQK